MNNLKISSAAIRNGWKQKRIRLALVRNEYLLFNNRITKQLH